MTNWHKVASFTIIGTSLSAPELQLARYIFVGKGKIIFMLADKTISCKQFFFSFFFLFFLSFSVLSKRYLVSWFLDNTLLWSIAVSNCNFCCCCHFIWKIIFSPPVFPLPFSFLSFFLLVCLFLTCCPTANLNERQIFSSILLALFFFGSGRQINDEAFLEMLVSVWNKSEEFSMM